MCKNSVVSFPSAASMNFLMLLLVPSILIAQAPDTLWGAMYGGAFSDRANSIRELPDGGFITVGTTMSFVSPPGGDTNVWLMRLDATGDTLWTRSIGEDCLDYGNSVDLTSDGGFIIAGETKSYGAENYDMLILKTDGDGNVLWVQTYGGSGYDKAFSVEETFDGNYIVGGYGVSFGAGQDDGYLLKLDSSGNVLWFKTFGGPHVDTVRELQETEDHGYILGGTSWYNGSDLWLVKTDADGNLIWENTYSGSADDWGQGVDQTADGGYIITGNGFSNSAGQTDLQLIRTDSNGTQLWYKTFGGTNYDTGYTVRETENLGFIVGGWTRSYGAGSMDIWLIRTNSAGDPMWTQTYGAGNYESVRNLRICNDGGYITAGHTASYGGNELFWILRTEPDMSSSSIADHGIPCTGNLFYSYPNPFQYSTTIEFNIVQAGSVSLNVYDTFGRIVRNLSDCSLSSGTHTVVWDGLNESGSALPPGVYLYTLEANGDTETRRTVLIR